MSLAHPLFAEVLLRQLPALAGAAGCVASSPRRSKPSGPAAATTGSGSSPGGSTAAARSTPRTCCTRHASPSSTATTPSPSASSSGPWRRAVGARGERAARRAPLPPQRTRAARGGARRHRPDRARRGRPGARRAPPLGEPVLRPDRRRPGARRARRERRRLHRTRRAWTPSPPTGPRSCRWRAASTTPSTCSEPLLDTATTGCGSRCSAARSLALAAAGRGEDALALIDEGARLHDQFDRDLTRPGRSILLFNELFALTELGRLDEARAIGTRRPPKDVVGGRVTWLAFARPRVELLAGDAGRRPRHERAVRPRGARPWRVRCRALGAVARRHGPTPRRRRRGRGPRHRSRRRALAPGHTACSGAIATGPSAGWPPSAGGPDAAREVLPRRRGQRARSAARSRSRRCCCTTSCGSAGAPRWSTGSSSWRRPCRVTLAAARADHAAGVVAADPGRLRGGRRRVRAARLAAARRRGGARPRRRRRRGGDRRSTTRPTERAERLRASSTCVVRLDWRDRSARRGSGRVGEQARPAAPSSIASAISDVHAPPRCLGLGGPARSPATVGDGRDQGVADEGVVGGVDAVALVAQAEHPGPLEEAGRSAAAATRRRSSSTSLLRCAVQVRRGTGGGPTGAARRGGRRSRWRSGRRRRSTSAAVRWTIASCSGVIGPRHRSERHVSSHMVGIPARMAAWDGAGPAGDDAHRSTTARTAGSGGGARRRATWPASEVGGERGEGDGHGEPGTPARDGRHAGAGGEHEHADPEQVAPGTGEGDDDPGVHRSRLRRLGVQAGDATPARDREHGPRCSGTGVRRARRRPRGGGGVASRLGS